MTTLLNKFQQRAPALAQMKNLMPFQNPPKAVHGNHLSMVIARTPGRHLGAALPGIHAIWGLLGGAAVRIHNHGANLLTTSKQFQPYHDFNGHLSHGYRLHCYTR